MVGSHSIQSSQYCHVLLCLLCTDSCLPPCSSLHLSLAASFCFIQECQHLSLPSSPHSLCFIGKFHHCRLSPCHTAASLFSAIKGKGNLKFVREVLETALILEPTCVRMELLLSSPSLPHLSKPCKKSGTYSGTQLVQKGRACYITWASRQLVYMCVWVDALIL